MIKWPTCSLLAILILLIRTDTLGQQITLLKKTHLSFYPSASGIEYFKNRLFVIGDDATHLLVLDTTHKVIDSLRLFMATNKRIHKDAKTDLEAAAMLKSKGKHFLMLVSSFSLPQRNKIYLLPLSPAGLPLQGRVIAANAEAFNQTTLNIEGAAVVKKSIIYSNRANNTTKENQLLVLKRSLLNTLNFKNSKSIPVYLPSSKAVIGISGLVYSKEKDLLLFTASTEDTDNAYDDGTIGKSYIGFIKNASKKLKGKSIKADTLVDLQQLLHGEVHKMEAIAIQSINKESIVAHLASDNDNGESTLFKIQIQLR